MKLWLYKGAGILRSVRICFSIYKVIHPSFLLTYLSMSFCVALSRNHVSSPYVFYKLSWRLPHHLFHQWKELPWKELLSSVDSDWAAGIQVVLASSLTPVPWLLVNLGVTHLEFICMWVYLSIWYPFSSRFIWLIYRIFGSYYFLRHLFVFIGHNKSSLA